MAEHGTRSVKWPRIATMWLDGATTVAIANTLSMTHQQVRSEMTHMRRAGWDLPRRRISDQGAEACAEAGRKAGGGGWTHEQRLAKEAVADG